MAQLGNDSHSLLPSLPLSQSTLMPQKHNLDNWSQGIQWEESSKKQFEAEFPKFWGKLFEEDFQHSSLAVSYPVLTRQDEAGTPTKARQGRSRSQSTLLIA